MRKAFVMTLISILFAAAVLGVEDSATAGKKNSPLLMLQARAGYFVPAQAAFRDIYGGGPVLGAEARFGRGHLGLWLEGSYFAGSGELSETAEPTDVKIMAVEGGGLWKIKPGKMSPYIGVGAGYYHFRETNVIGEARQGKVGFCAVAGAILTFGRHMVLDGRLKYNTCRMQPADFAIDIGGLTAGIGLGLRI